MNEAERWPAAEHPLQMVVFSPCRRRPRRPCACCRETKKLAAHALGVLRANDVRSKSLLGERCTACGKPCEYRMWVGPGAHVPVCEGSPACEDKIGKMASERVVLKLREEPLERDAYGNPVRSSKRHPDCSCTVPCQRTFMCRDKRHVGSRSVPWCCGGHPGDECNDCFVAIENEKRIWLWALGFAAWMTSQR